MIHIAGNCTVPPRNETLILLYKLHGRGPNGIFNLARGRPSMTTLGNMTTHFARESYFNDDEVKNGF